MSRSIAQSFPRIALIGSFAMAPAHAALAQGAGQPLAGEVEVTKPGQTHEVKFTVSGGLEYQFRSDLDDGGHFAVTRVGAGLGLQTDINTDLHFSLRLGYGLDLYDFESSTLGGPAGTDPWSDIHTVSAGALLAWDAADKWTVFGGPLIQSARENGADFGDSITGGGLLGASYQFSTDLTLGGGFGVVTQIEEDPRLFPIIVVDWKIADRLHLASQAAGSASGRMGLELIYEAGHGWEFALGAARQFSRFRLDDQDVAPDGVGQDESTPLWLRASYNLSKRVRLDALAGVTGGGEMRLEDSNGDRLANQEYDLPFFGGVFVSVRF